MFFETNGHLTGWNNFFALCWNESFINFLSRYKTRPVTRPKNQDQILEQYSVGRAIIVSSIWTCVQHVIFLLVVCTIKILYEFFSHRSYPFFMPCTCHPPPMRNPKNIAKEYKLQCVCLMNLFNSCLIPTLSWIQTLSQSQNLKHCPFLPHLRSSCGH
jgi:hypothetical protein